MQRVRIKEWRKTENDYIPYVELADGSLREVLIASQPGSQEAVMAALETEVLFSGGRAPGKTRTIIGSFLSNVGQGYGPNWKGIMIRPSMQGFDEIKALCETMIRPVFPNARYNINKSEWVWYWNGQPGEVLRLGYFQGNEDFAQYQGSSKQFINFDELTQFPDDAPYRNMLSVLRPSGGINVPLMVRSTTNPNGPGFAWVKRRFKCDDLHIQGYRVGPHIPKDAEGLDRRVIYGHLEENQRMLTEVPHYLDNLKASAARPGELDAWTKGSWSITSGGLFDSDIAETQQYSLLPSIPAQAIPQGGKIISSFDWGDASPFAKLYAYISDGSPIAHGGRVYSFIRGDTIVFHEIYGVSPLRPSDGVRWTTNQMKTAFIEYENANGLRYQDPASGRIIYRVSTAIADNQIFNKKPGQLGNLETA